LTRTLISEEELIQVLNTGTEEAFDLLYKNYSAAIFGSILKIVQNKELAEDLTQESFIKIWNNFSSFDASKGRLYTWMLHIARNTSIDALKSKQERNNQQNQDLQNSVYTVDQQYQTNVSTDSIGLKKILEALPKEQMEILQKMYFEGYTQAEIAKDFEIPLGTVKTRARLAIQKLRYVFNNSRKGGGIS
jgi:RNA polymerase sigma-70 factor (ECF subfamily)